MSEKNETEKQSTSISGLGGKREGAGRPAGVPNKITASVKEMLLTALEEGGGVKYFRKQMDENPTAFMSLIGRLLPKDVNATVAVSQMDKDQAIAYFADMGITPEIDHE